MNNTQGQQQVFARLVSVDRQGRVGKAFCLCQQSCTLGRATDLCDIRIYRPEVSAQHSRVTVDQHNSLWIENLSQTNPTFLNGKPVVEKIPLVHGDIITVGTKSFLIELPTHNEFIISSKANVKLQGPQLLDDSTTALHIPIHINKQQTQNINAPKANTKVETLPEPLMREILAPPKLKPTPILKKTVLGQLERLSLLRRLEQFDKSNLHHVDQGNRPQILLNFGLISYSIKHMKVDIGLKKGLPRQNLFKAMSLCHADIINGKLLNHVTTSSFFSFRNFCFLLKEIPRGTELRHISQTAHGNALSRTSLIQQIQNGTVNLKSISPMPRVTLLARTMVFLHLKAKSHLREIRPRVSNFLLNQGYILRAITQPVSLKKISQTPSKHVRLQRVCLELRARYGKGLSLRNVTTEGSKFQKFSVVLQDILKGPSLKKKFTLSAVSQFSSEELCLARDKLHHISHFPRFSPLTWIHILHRVTEPQPLKKVTVPASTFFHESKLLMLIQKGNWNLKSVYTRENECIKRAYLLIQLRGNKPMLQPLFKSLPTSLLSEVRSFNREQQLRPIHKFLGRELQDEIKHFDRSNLFHVTETSGVKTTNALLQDIRNFRGPLKPFNRVLAKSELLLHALLLRELDVPLSSRKLKVQPQVPKRENITRWSKVLFCLEKFNLAELKKINQFAHFAVDTAWLTNRAKLIFFIETFDKDCLKPIPISNAQFEEVTQTVSKFDEEEEEVEIQLSASVDERQVSEMIVDSGAVCEPATSASREAAHLTLDTPSEFDSSAVEDSAASKRYNLRSRSRKPLSNLNHALGESEDAKKVRGGRAKSRGVKKVLS